MESSQKLPNFDFQFIIKMMPYSRHLAINPKLKIPLGYLDSYAEIFLILCTPLGNSTTRIAILDAVVCYTK